jgi:uncharacterized membrane protein
MGLAELWTWIENLPVAGHIGATWWFPLLESVHVVSATFVVGSILMVDLRLLDLAARRHPVSRITKEVVPWTYGACAVSVMTGAGMFISRATHYVDNPAFEIKMALLVLAGINMAVFHLATARGIARWDTATATTAAAKFAGASSLLLWISVMLAGRWIGHLS